MGHFKRSSQWQILKYVDDDLSLLDLSGANQSEMLCTRKGSYCCKRSTAEWQKYLMSETKKGK